MNRSMPIHTVCWLWRAPYSICFYLFILWSSILVMFLIWSSIFLLISFFWNFKRKAHVLHISRSRPIPCVDLGGPHRFTLVGDFVIHIPRISLLFFFFFFWEFQRKVQLLVVTFEKIIKYLERIINVYSFLLYEL